MRTIKKELIALFLGILLVFLVSSVTDTYLDRRFFEDNRILLENYEKMNSVVSYYDESRIQFRQYHRVRVRENLTLYRIAMRNVEKGLEELSPYFKDQEDTLLYARISRQMLEHRTELIEAYVSYIQQGDNLSEDLAYIDTLSARITTSLNQLASAYLKVMNEENEKNVLAYRDAQNVSNGLLFLFLAVLVLTGLLAFYKMKGKLLETTEALREIGQKNFDGKNLTRTRYLDVNVYIDTVNDMKGEIKDLITQTEDYAKKEIAYETQKRLLAESSMRELQFQINPHFLFNTLSIMIRHIQFGEPETSILLIRETSKILRSSLGKRKKEMSLDDELDLLNSYIFIQKMHLKDRVDITMEVVKGYGGNPVTVPPLVVQPLLENAVMHGMKETSSGGKIHVLILEKPDRFLVSVADNGIGMKEEDVEEMLKKKEEGHIGLYNVIRRLQLYYGREDVYEIESAKGAGTKVTLFLYKERREAP
ncbi:sensor histidine kinase [Proteiniclasticum ruminis]|uniref:sensor histidine kinase n=1 Tax=Proteiniclasticum ruminis TaxID=398199 RepID=UPI0028AF89E8|nr:histidine kinase [Proteiniclasticum ruminis]